MRIVVNDPEHRWSAHGEAHHVKHVHVLEKLSDPGARSAKWTAGVLAVQAAFRVASSKADPHGVGQADEDNEDEQDPDVTHSREEEN